MSHYSLGTYIPLPSTADSLVASPWPSSQPRLVLPPPAILQGSAAVPTGRFYIRDILTTPAHAPCASSHMVAGTCALSPVSPHQLLGQPEVVAPSSLHATSPIQPPPVSTPLLSVSPWPTQQQSESSLQSARQQDGACVRLQQHPQVILQHLQPRARLESETAGGCCNQLQAMLPLPTSLSHSQTNHHHEPHSLNPRHHVPQSQQIPRHVPLGHNTSQHKQGCHHANITHHSISQHPHSHHGHHGPRPERCMFTRDQRLRLEEEFRLNKYITKGERNHLAGLLGLKRKQVTTWFQNRRARERRKRRSSLQTNRDKGDDHADDGEEDILDHDASAMSSIDDDSDSFDEP